MKFYFSGGAMLLALEILGCTADVKETPDSTKVEIEVPKVETGDRSPDMNPSTDDDVDVDTPLPGDS